MNAVFANRRDAGQKLAHQLAAYGNKPETIVLGLPRGGVPVAYEIATRLNLPLDICLVKKLGFPNYPETAMGAISLTFTLTIAEEALVHNYSDNVTIFDQGRTEISGLSPEQIQAIAAKEKAELKWRESCYRHSRPMLTIANQIVIVVDDGIATGLTMEATVEVLHQNQPKEIIIATPVASWQAIAKLQHQVDHLVSLITPKRLGAVGCWYEDFSQTSDQEVCNLLTDQRPNILRRSY